MTRVDREDGIPFSYDVASIPYIENGKSPPVNHQPPPDPETRKFKLVMDAHVPRKLSRFLRNDGHDVTDVNDVDPHLPDTKIVKMSKQEKRIIVSGDSDFGQLIFEHAFDPHSVIFVKYYPFSNKICRIVYDQMRQLLESVDTLEGKIAVIAMGKTRVIDYNGAKKMD